MTIRMGYWDCPSCNQKKNLGPNATCAQCGRPRGPNIPFYTDESAPVVEDPELVARARAGADWKCKYCSADNRAGVMDCHQCGAGPDGSVKRAVTFVGAPTAPAASPPWGKILGIVGGVLGLLGLLVWFFFIRTTAMSVTVDSVSWVKTAQLEALETRRGESWADEKPAGSRELSRTTKGRSKKVQEGTEKVKVGKKDLGNGMFEDVYEEKPKYVTKQVDEPWVTYEVDEWVAKQALRAETQNGEEPEDPAADVRLDSKKRIGSRSNQAVYALTGKDGKKLEFTIDVDKEGAAALKKYKVGSSYTAQVTSLGAVKALGP
jgi:hypothetical protein